MRIIEPHILLLEVDKTLSLCPVAIEPSSNGIERYELIPSPTEGLDNYQYHVSDHCSVIHPDCIPVHKAEERISQFYPCDFQPIRLPSLNDALANYQG